MTDQAFCFLTVTWAADLGHFALLRESLERSPLAHIEHHVVVQDEDLAAFRQFSGPGLFLHSSADVLPSAVEAKRRSSLQWQQRFGRRGAKLGGSVTRYLGWPKWVRYTGWHTQQLSKLAFVGESAHETVVILDSDVIVTPYACEADFLSPGKVVCFEHWKETDQLRGKVANWQQTARELLRSSTPAGSRYDGYYDTPFVMHAPSVRGLMEYLEQTYKQQWWQALVNMPPRRWSEFGIYKQYLRDRAAVDLDWREADIFGYIFDASDEGVLVRQFDRLLEQNKNHFITLHSQNSGRMRWSADRHKDLLLERLAEFDKKLLEPSS